MRIECTAELHRRGGPGAFYLARAENTFDSLLAPYRGRVQLIYLDPPFGTGDVFRAAPAQGKPGLAAPAFEDRLCGDDYLVWMRRVLTGAREMLSDTGSLYLHIDYRKSAPLKLLLDEIFGEGNFMNEIIWRYRSGGRSVRHYPRKHDTIYFYRKSPKVFFNIAAVGRPRGPEKRNHMKRFIDEDGRICFSIRSGGKVYTYYEDTPVYPSDVWDDIEHLQQKDRERVGYDTQKPEALLERVILASSRENDLVLDLFSGSGTTAAVARRLGRRFLALDASPAALYTLRARLLKGASARSLLDGEHDLSLSYPADAAEAAFACSVSEEGGKRKLLVEEARFDDAYPLVYAALGTIEEGVFLAARTELHPVLPLRFPLGGIEKPVVQFADARGRQAFFTVD